MCSDSPHTFKLNEVIPTIFDFHTIQSVQLQIEVPFTAKKSANFFELLDLLFFDGRIVQFGLKPSGTSRCSPVPGLVAANCKPLE